MAQTELVWFPGTCSRVTLIALEEIGEPFSTRTITGNRSEDPEFLALNPKGKVPLLVIDGIRLTENTAIVSYLARTRPQARLLPRDDLLVEIDALATMSWFAAGVHPAITRMRFPERFCDAPGSADRTRTLAGEVLLGCFEIIEERLADRDWLYEEWSVVDGYLLWVWFRAVGSGIDGSRFPRCAAHAQRCEQRPSVARALDREEAEYARLLAAGTAGVTRPYQVGRAPVPAAPSAA
jgi:glutathione S-transferase